MRKQKIYLDTCVFGGYYDKEFQKHTRTLFEKIENGEFEVYWSEIIARELRKAPQNVQEVENRIPKECITNIRVNEEVKRLSNQYIGMGIVSQKSLDDTLHIALATVHNIDMLISWNFKHIVHADKMKRYNAVSVMCGYKAIEIISPSNIIY